MKSENVLDVRILLPVHVKALSLCLSQCPTLQCQEAPESELGFSVPSVGELPLAHYGAGKKGSQGGRRPRWQATKDSRKLPL